MAIFSFFYVMVSTRTYLTCTLCRNPGAEANLDLG